jgi:hypothetical protein
MRNLNFTNFEQAGGPLEVLVLVIMAGYVLAVSAALSGGAIGLLLLFGRSLRPLVCGP